MMSTAETVLIAFLSSGVLVAVIQIIDKVLTFRRERRAKKEDDNVNDMKKRLERLEEQSDAQSEALKFLLFDRIRTLGQQYIFAGEIDLNDQKILHDMHKSYEKNGGNGDLDTLMRQVDALQLKKGG